MKSYDDYEQFAFERLEPGILLITLNRPEKFNACDEAMHTDLTRIWTDVSKDPDVRVVVITGAGKAFSAGGDMAMVERLTGDYGRVARMLDEATAMVSNILACEKPVVSAINGAAVGAGLTVGLLADISIIAEDAMIGDGHARLGVAAGDHAAIIWPLLAGMAKSRYYLLTGDMLSGAEADRLGMVWKAVAREKVLEEALAVARKLATGPQDSIRWTRRALNNWVRAAGPIFEQSAALEMLTFLGPDVVEGRSAIVEKRAPRFPSAR